MRFLRWKALVHSVLRSLMMFQTHRLISASARLLSAGVFALLVCGAFAASAATNYRPLDLARFCNHTNEVVARLGQSVTFHGVPFQLSGSIRVTGMDAARRGELWPTEIDGIPVSARASRLHLLLGAHHGQRDGTPLANLVLHFRDGERHAARLAFGVHARNVAIDEDTLETPLADPNARVAWQTNLGTRIVRLHHAMFDNPFPEKEIARIEFASLFSRATPVLFAVTLQSGETSPLLSLPKTRAWERAIEATDSAQRRQITLRALGENGVVLTNALAAVSITDDAKTFFLGDFRAGPKGEIPVSFPPQDTVALQLRVNSAGYAPETLTLSGREALALANATNIVLTPGVTISGTVVTPEKQPVAGALVVPFWVTPAGSNEFTRHDLDMVSSDAQGRWSVRASPQLASNLLVEVKHPDFHDSIVSLAAGGTRVELNPHVRIAGRVVDPAGKPVSGARLQLSNNDGFADNRETDVEGRFAFIIREPSDNSATLVAITDQFAPAQETLLLSRTSPNLTVTLTNGRPFTMRLVERDGSPVPGVEVTLRRWQNSYAMLWSGQTDENGRFTWSNAPSGPVMFRFEKPGYNTHSHSTTLPVTGEAELTYSRPVRFGGTVVDEKTGEPIASFRARLRYKYERGSGSSSTSGRRGTFTISLTSGGRSAFTEMVLELDANQYEPLKVEIPPPYASGSNVYRMRKAQLLEAAVFAPNGAPAPRAQVVLLEPGNSAYMDEPGVFRRWNDYEVVESEDNGAVALAPTPTMDLVLASHPKLGFVQMTVEELKRSKRIPLQPWGHVRGVLRVGEKVQPDHLAAIHTHFVGTEGERKVAPLYLYYQLQPSPDGKFHFDAVPPGERMAQLRYKPADGESGPLRLSHNVPILVKPGETNEVVIGGEGRTVTGRVAITNAPEVKIDGRRGDFTLRLRPGRLPSEIPPPLVYPPNASAEERRRLRDEHRLKSQEMSRTHVQSLRQRQRYYFPVFDDNNGFVIPNVPPGEYTLEISPHDPRAPRGTTRSLGSVSRTVQVPEGTTPFDLGEITIPARR